MSQTLPVPTTKVSNAPTTHLPHTIEVPWEDRFNLGYGVNALTGEAMARAIEPFTLAQSLLKTVEMQFKSVDSEESVEQKVEASVSGQFNIYGVDVHAESSLLNKISSSATSLTIMASETVDYTQPDLCQQYELSREAKERLRDPEAFRRAYGDYFVAGYRRSASFNAMYVCETSDAASLIDFKASLSAKQPDVFEASGSVEFMRLAQKHSVSVSCTLIMSGYKGQIKVSNPDPEQIVELLRDFNAHEVGVPTTAILWHYSRVNPDFPDTVPYAQSVFMDLRQLYKNYWMGAALLGGIPKFYKESLANKYDAVAGRVMGEKDNLVQDTTLRRQLSEDIQDVVDEMNEVLARQAFYYEVLAKRHLEPTGWQEERKRGPVAWEYGYSQSNGNPANQPQFVFYKSYEKHYRIGHRENTFRYHQPGKIIVGWRVHSVWGDGTNGKWRADELPILGTDELIVSVESEYDRGCSWSVCAWAVDLDDYRFGADAE